MPPARPEVVFLRPLHGVTKLEIAWQCLMVEYGIAFDFDDDHRLPDRLPDDLRGMKAVCIDPSSWEEYHRGETGRRLEGLGADGVVVFRFSGPEQFDVIDETATRGDLEMLIASANLTIDHPALRARLQARTFRQLYQSLREPYLLGQIDNGLRRGPDTVFAEPFTYLILQTLETLDEFDPAFGWQDRLRSTLDSMLAMRPGDPDTLDGTAGLDVFVRMTRRTGDGRYAEFASRQARHVTERYPRIEGVPVLQPGRDRILWNECLALLPPACAALGEKTLVDLAIHTAHTIHRLNCDPDKRLWRHWGAPGRRGPALWARGQGWALTGLIGILRSLPDGHPERPALVRYVEEIVDGLADTQTAEGLWHNVLDDPRTRVCCRASSMFVYLLAEARRRGWVRSDGLDALLHRAWRGVRGRVWTDKLACVCCGTGAGATWQHYAARPMIFWGASAALRAGCAYTLAFEEL